MKKSFCRKCGKKLSAVRYKHCNSCKKNGFKGKHHTKKNKLLMSKIKKDLVKNNLFIKEKHPKWKGGLKHSTGYIFEYSPTHPYNKDKYCLQHRIIMEKHIGRILNKNEVVHHINNNRHDNRIENLMLFSNHSEHLKFHIKHQNRKRDMFGKFIKFSKVKKGCMPI